MKKIFVVFSFLLLIYMLWPGPTKISNFKPLPDSDKSTLEGDTIQIPNVAAYFSDNYREFVVPFYSRDYQSLSRLPFPPLVLNHPPEYSWSVIKKHTDSTYIEELYYPLRDSLFVNGFEPFYAQGGPKYWGATKFEVEGKALFTKTTLRFYPSSFMAKLFTWVGIIFSIFLVYRLAGKILL